MTAPGFIDAGEGDFHGRPVRRFESESLWLEVLSDGGPRILRFGLIGGPNLFAETPDAGWPAGGGRFELLGGHRLWYAPETLRPDAPDRSGLEIQPVGDGMRLIGRREASGLRRTIEIRTSGGSELSVRHELANEGLSPLELAVWAITQLRLGGVVLVPQPSRRPEHAIAANRLVALWPYSSWDDDRFTLGDGVMGVAAAGAPAFKVGCLNHAGIAAYLRDGTVFLKQFEPASAAPHADYGCNTEVYTDERCVEMETLGPLVTLRPGEAALHTERWEVSRTTLPVPNPHDLPALRAALTELGIG